MKQYLPPLDYALWISTIFLEFLVLYCALAGKLQRQSPKFSLYIAFLCFKSSILILLSLAASYSWYFWAFYGGAAIETVLLILAIYEVFKDTFDPLGVLPPGTIARMLTLIITSASLLIAAFIWRPALTSPLVNSLTALLRTIHQTIDSIVALALFTLVMYARHHAIPWRSRTAGIAAGFLFLLSGEGFLRAGQSFAPHSWFIWFDRALAIVACLTLAMWVRATRRPEEISTELPTPEALKQARASIAQMHSVLTSIKVVAKTKWSVE